MVSVLRPGKRILHIPGIGITTSRRAVGGGNGLLNNLVIYCALDEAAGANDALDKHTNGLTLTQTASPGSAAGKVYSGARTCNAGQQFSRASEALLQAGSGSFSIAAWAKYDGGNDRGLLAKRDTGEPEYQIAVYSVSSPYYLTWYIRKADNSARLSIIRNETLPTNTWFLVLAWYDHSAGTLNLQVNDGTIYTNNCGSVGIWQSTNYLRIGTYYSTGSNWTGPLGPIAMWKGRAFSAADRAALYNSGAGLAYAAFTT